ncbi:MAG: molybdenum cofactor biosynthesis protein MoaE [Saprospiraceae bacterium]|nr:molybdenum cofactor biosynthesis protein MoaE [Saprospiraceae bacterium]
MTETFDIQLRSSSLSLTQCYEFVSHEGCGGIDIFVGTVRNHTAGKTVVALDFEAYEPMALAEMRKIAVSMMEKFQTVKIAIHHRTGLLKIGDEAVIIAVSAAHRAAAFAACRYAIDTLKETVPIWKKEIFADGEVWVAAHP